MLPTSSAGGGGGCLHPILDLGDRKPRFATLMASTAHAEERDGLDSSGLPINKGLSVDVVKPPAMDAVTAAQRKEEGMGEQPVKARKPYRITKQREKWTEEEHEKFLDALKLYGRSWRQIQEHIGTKTAVQIRSHAQKFFSKVVREPAAKLAIEIPPPRPKRKPLHPYPRKSAANSSNGANPATEHPKHALVLSSSSGSDQENGGSPVSVLSAMQSDAFGSSMSNPSPESSDDENNNVPPVVSGEEGQQTWIDESNKEPDQDNRDDTGMSEEDSSDEVQRTSLKLFGKTVVVIPDPRKRCPSSDENGEQIIPQSSTKGTAHAPSSAGEVLPAYTAPNGGWVLPYNSYPLPLVAESAAPLHVWWPYYGFPVGHPRGAPSTVTHNEATDESDAVMNPPVESSSDDSDDGTQTASKKCKVLESVETTRVPRSASTFELKPSMNSAFVRVKKPVSGSGDQPPVRGFVPYKRCRAE